MCTKCTNDDFINRRVSPNECVDKCPPKTLLEGKICHACEVEFCDICPTTKTCSKCEPGKLVAVGKKLCIDAKCNDDEYIDPTGTFCEKCSTTISSCIACKYEPVPKVTKCSKCAPGKFIRIDNEECLSKCPNDEFPLNTKCTKCNSYMKDC